MEKTVVSDTVHASEQCEDVKITFPHSGSLSTTLPMAAEIMLAASSCIARFRRWSVAIGHHNNFFQSPNVIAQTSSQAWRDPQSLVDSGEIVVYGVDRNHSRMILNFLAEGIRQSGEAPHTHPHT